MKTLRHTLILLLALLSMYGCQEIEEPQNTIPTVVTDAVEKYSGYMAWLSGSVTSRANCYFLLSTLADLSDARKIEVNQRHDEERGKWFCQSEAGDLQAGTTYYVVLCATDGKSEVKGNVVEFTTSSYLSIESATYNGRELGWDSFSLYITDSEDNVEDKAGNLRVKNEYIDEVLSWQLPYDFLLSKPSYKVYACNYDNQNPLESLEIPVSARGYEDCIYGSDQVTPANPKANIEFKSALATLHFLISTDNAESVSVSHFNLRNNRNLPTGTERLSISGTLDLTTGKITPIPIAGHDGILFETGAIQPGKSVERIIKVIPTTFEDEELELVAYIGNQPIIIPLPASTWEGGKNYEIPIKISVPKDNSKAKVGDYYYSDGTWSTAYNADKECIGIVFALSEEANGDIDVSLKESEHGRIVALEDAGNSKWGTEDQIYDALIFGRLYENAPDHGYLPMDGKSEYTWSSTEGTQIPYSYENWPTPSIDIDPKWALFDYKGSDWTHYFGYGDTAAAMCCNYKKGDVQWYLPSVGEMARFAMAYAYGIISNSKQSVFKAPIEEDYWTSCAFYRDPYSSSSSWVYFFPTNHLSIRQIDSGNMVRPIASF